MRRVLAWMIIGLAWLPATGCGVLVASLEVPIDSAAGVLQAVGGSLAGILNSCGIGTGSSDLTEYRRDLRQYAALSIRGGDDGTPQSFQRGITRIAESHGIANWEAEPATPYAIGQGFRDANVSETAMLDFCAALGSDTAAARYAMEGWRAGGS